MVDGIATEGQRLLKVSPEVMRQAARNPPFPLAQMDITTVKGRSAVVRGPGPRLM